MPLYQYEKNGKRIELRYPYGKAPMTYKGYRRVLNMPQVRFKGDGWTGAMRRS